MICDGEQGKFHEIIAEEQNLFMRFAMGKIIKLFFFSFHRKSLEKNDDCKTNEAKSTRIFLMSMKTLILLIKIIQEMKKVALKNVF